MRTVEVFIDLGSGLCLTYRVPESLAAELEVGVRVRVPLSGRTVEGIVIRLGVGEAVSGGKELAGVIDPAPVLTPGLVSLAEAVSSYYLSPLPRTLKSVLPAAVRKGLRARETARARLAVPPGLFEQELSRLSRAPRQGALLKCLREAGEAGMPVPDLLARALAPRASLQALIGRGLVVLEKSRHAAPAEALVPTAPLNLTAEQAGVFGRVAAGIAAGGFKIFLLHGITGSGKTEIYLQAVEKIIASGRQAIVLVPEISLTPQTSERFRARFGERVAVLHSALAEGERSETWRRIRAGEAAIVLGPRSAVFAPLQAPGIIVVDEEHETSYKQGENSPYYHARDVAILRAKLEGIPVILGSATPSLESYHNARHGRGELLVLRARPQEAELARVRIVDMRREAEFAGRPVSFSRELMSAMGRCLEAGGQCILFLNRRGFNTAAVCRQCAHVLRCRHCSVALTHHRTRGRLVCHFCGHSEPVPRFCPLCRSPEIDLKGMGTERVEDQIRRCFPGIPVERMDTDTVGGRGSHEKVLNRFRRGGTRILVGTQMIAKGLDIPGVTLVGVVFADTALNLADFRSAEYTFQILTQVAGRSGRGEAEGEVVIQTYNPSHPALKAAARQDYEAFYSSEIRTRAELSFPPLVHLVGLTVSSRVEAKSQAAAEYLSGRIGPLLPAGAELLGPAIPPVERVRGHFRRQILIRNREVLPVNRALAAALADFPARQGVKVEVDVDPVSML